MCRVKYARVFVIVIPKATSMITIIITICGSVAVNDRITELGLLLIHHCSCFGLSIYEVAY